MRAESSLDDLARCIERGEICLFWGIVDPRHDQDVAEEHAPKKHDRKSVDPSVRQHRSWWHLSAASIAKGELITEDSLYAPERTFIEIHHPQSPWPLTYGPQTVTLCAQLRSPAKSACT